MIERYSNTADLAVIEGEIVEPGSPEDLIPRINAEHGACEAAYGMALEHAIRCGELLIEAKAGVKHGDWLPWLGRNFEGSRQAAALYMRIAENWPLLYVQRVVRLAARGLDKHEMERRYRQRRPLWDHALVAGYADGGRVDVLLSFAQHEQMSVREADKLIREHRKAIKAAESNKAADAANNTLRGDVAPARDVHPGDIWRLGDHAIYVGDTSSVEFIDLCPSAAFAFADPPYNAGVDDWDNDFNWQHDYLIDKAPVVAVTPGIASTFDFARVTDMPYVWAAACYITNGQARGAMGFGLWIYVALFSRGSVYRNAQDVLRIALDPKEHGITQHKGRKPSKLLVWLLDTFTRPGDTVVDPFLGSGTTLFAAEATGRKCFGGEIDPAYVAEIVARWEKATGRSAERVVSTEPRMVA